MQVPSGEWDCLNQTPSPKLLSSLLKEPNKLGGLVAQEQMWAGPALCGWLDPSRTRTPLSSGANKNSFYLQGSQKS